MNSKRRKFINENHKLVQRELENKNDDPIYKSYSKRVGIIKSCIDFEFSTNDCYNIVQCHNVTTCFRRE